jgi:hypothetical protein
VILPGLCLLFPRVSDRHPMKGGDGRMSGKASRLPGRHESRDPDWGSRLACRAAWLTLAASVISLVAALLAFAY